MVASCCSPDLASHACSGALEPSRSRWAAIEGIRHWTGHGSWRFTLPDSGGSWLDNLQS